MTFVVVYKYSRNIFLLLYNLVLINVISTAAYADDRSMICIRGHSQTLRLHGHEYTALRNAAFARAGVPVSLQCHENKAVGLSSKIFDKCYILDHIIPLELCLNADDCNRLDNIQVQTKADAVAKDRIENRERYRYCRSDETREQAISRFTRSAP